MKYGAEKLTPPPVWPFNLFATSRTDFQNGNFGWEDE